MKAILVGSIANLGSQYVIGLEALDCQSGNVLASEQAQASSKEQVLDAVGKTASRIRERLGESLASIQNSDKPLTEATTSLDRSSESLQHGQQSDVGGQNIAMYSLLRTGHRA